MMTVMTEITIEPGQEAEWDRAFQDRFKDAPNQPGWVSVQLLIPVDAPNRRLVIGTWHSRADWEAWHATETFKRTREAMNRVQQQSGSEHWYEVVNRAATGT